jgi:ribosome-interacting GTPase 1
MPDYSAKIKELEDRISSTKYNKKTQAAIGQYKAQIAKLKEKEESRGSGTSGGQGWERSFSLVFQVQVSLHY